MEKIIIVCSECGHSANLTDLVMLDGWTPLVGEDVPTDVILRESEFQCSACKETCTIQHYQGYQVISQKVGEEVLDELTVIVEPLEGSDGKSIEPLPIKGEFDELGEIDEDETEDETDDPQTDTPTTPTTVDSQADLDVGGGLKDDPACQSTTSDDTPDSP